MPTHVTLWQFTEQGVESIRGDLLLAVNGEASHGTVPLGWDICWSLLWRRLLVTHSAVLRMVFSASFPGFRYTRRR
ncbi:hypothetical protein, partial [Natronobacterium gregoryi]